MKLFDKLMIAVQDGKPLDKIYYDDLSREELKLLVFKLESLALYYRNLWRWSFTSICRHLVNTVGSIEEIEKRSGFKIED